MQFNTPTLELARYAVASVSAGQAQLIRGTKVCVSPPPRLIPQSGTETQGLIPQSETTVLDTATLEPP